MSTTVAHDSMQSSRLHIDTKITSSNGQYSAKPSVRTRRLNGSTSSASSNGASLRMRSASNASSSSSISILSPGPSSSNASPTSASRAASLEPEASPNGDGDNTIRTADEFVLAMHDFSPSPPNPTCLSFQAGQVVHVLNRDASGWWDGELDGRRGWFPSNYVNTEIGVSPFVEETVANSIRFGHSHSSSASSWGSAMSPVAYTRGNRPLVTETLGSDIDSYCPPIMVPLLHGISLLQSAARSNRVTHFEPSTACIISCVRSVLAATHCLQRETSSYLTEFPVLFTERKRILKDLASLITQAKIAADERADELTRETEVDMMLRLGGQVFTHMRRFLAVAVQCGIELPEGQPSASEESAGEEDVEPPRTSPVTSTGSRKQLVKDRQSTVTQAEIRNSRSLGDLKGAQRRSTANNSALIAPQSRRTSAAKASHSSGRDSKGSNTVYTMGVGSSDTLASVDSSSSRDTDNEGPLPLPPFPSGPCSAMEVLDALKHTHDSYISTVAAFVGHAHSHSRFSHASSTGYMQDLVTEVVETVCRIMAIVEGVMRHPDIPQQKLVNLKLAKEGLYNVTTSLADVVRALAKDLSPNMSEEDEKTSLLRSATSALKSGADCVAAIKVCLSRTKGDTAFVIQLYPTADVEESTPPVSRSSVRVSIGKASSMTALRGRYQNDRETPEEDVTIQADVDTLASRPLQSSDESAIFSTASSLASLSTNRTSVDEGTERPISSIYGHGGSNGMQAPPASAPAHMIHRVPDEVPSFQDAEETALEDKLVGDDNTAVLPGRVPGINPDDPLSYSLAHDYADEDVAFNAEGHLVGATLQVLVEHLTPQGSLADGAFCAIFWPTFRLFTTPTELLDALIARYNLPPPMTLRGEAELLEWQRRKLVPVRLRVVNTIKQWLELKWRPSSDTVVLETLSKFTHDALIGGHFGAWQRIQELIDLRKHSPDLLVGPDRTKDPGISLNPPVALGASADVAKPIITKTLMANLRAKNFGSISILDFDALELARQITIMENQLYCEISAEEVLEAGQDGVKSPTTVKAVSTFSTAITGWVAESILNESDAKKRTALVKFFIKVSDRCVSMHNYSTPRSILAALDSSTISRLRMTWAGLSQKSRQQMEGLRKLADHGRNYHIYRSRLRTTSPPAVPFMGLYLTDVTFCREGNPSYRASPASQGKKLINFNKYHKLARIVQDMERFQVPYNLCRIPDAQAYLEGVFEAAKGHGDLQDLYRRSLLVEPRVPADTPPVSATDMGKLFGWATRSQAQQSPSLS